MKNEIIIKEIDSLLDKYQISVLFRLLNYMTDLKQGIIENTNFLDIKSKLSQRYYHIKYNFKRVPTCQLCGGITKFINFSKGYAVYCSRFCLNNDPRIVEKRKQTCLENYGVESPLQNKEIFEKVKRTNLERYGVEFIPQVPEVIEKTRNSWFKKTKNELEKIIDKRKETSISKYGVDNPNKSPIVKQKKKQIFLDKYGVDHPGKSDIVRTKTINTCLERYNVKFVTQTAHMKEKSKQTSLLTYGVENPSQSSEIKEKKIKTSLENYGVENPNQDSTVRQKIVNTCLERYGVDSPLKSARIRQKINNTIHTRYGVSSSLDLVKSKKRKNTSIEILLQQKLLDNKIIFLLSTCIKIGKVITWPDIFIEPNICIFADGIYYHGWPGKYKSDDLMFGTPMEKIWAKDKKISDTLTKNGFKVLRFWEFDIKKDINRCLDDIKGVI